MINSVSMCFSVVVQKSKAAKRRSDREEMPDINAYEWNSKLPQEVGQSIMIIYIVVSRFYFQPERDREVVAERLPPSRVQVAVPIAGKKN